MALIDDEEDKKTFAELYKKIRNELDYVKHFNIDMPFYDYDRAYMIDGILELKKINSTCRGIFCFH